MISENLRRSGFVRFPPQTQLSREPEFIRPLRVQTRDYSYSTLTAPSATLPSGLLVPALPANATANCQRYGTVQHQAPE